MGTPRGGLGTPQKPAPAFGGAAARAAAATPGGGGGGNILGQADGKCAEGRSGTSAGPKLSGAPAAAELAVGRGNIAGLAASAEGRLAAPPPANGGGGNPGPGPAAKKVRRPAAARPASGGVAGGKRKAFVPSTVPGRVDPAPCSAAEKRKAGVLAGISEAAGFTKRRREHGRGNTSAAGLGAGAGGKGNNPASVAGPDGSAHVEAGERPPIIDSGDDEEIVFHDKRAIVIDLSSDEEGPMGGCLDAIVLD